MARGLLGRTRMRPLLLVFVVGGCAPVASWPMLETARTLEKKQHSITVGGGVGGSTEVCCVGGAARYRYGLDGTHELGVDLGGGGVVASDGSGWVLGGRFAFK